MKTYHPAITVETKKLAASLVKLIHESPDGRCFKFGMFPAGLMEIFEKKLQERIPDSFYYKDGDKLEDRICDRGAEITKDVCFEALKSRHCLV